MCGKRGGEWGIPTHQEQTCFRKPNPISDNAWSASRATLARSPDLRTIWLTRQPVNGSLCLFLQPCAVSNGQVGDSTHHQKRDDSHVEAKSRNHPRLVASCRRLCRPDDRFHDRLTCVLHTEVGKKQKARPQADNRKHRKATVRSRVRVLIPLHSAIGITPLSVVRFHRSTTNTHKTEGPAYICPQGRSENGKVRATGSRLVSLGSPGVGTPG